MLAGDDEAPRFRVDAARPPFRGDGVSVSSFAGSTAGTGSASFSFVSLFSSVAGTAATGAELSEKGRLQKMFGNVKEDAPGVELVASVVAA